jgi:hypothetical protein
MGIAFFSFPIMEWRENTSCFYGSALALFLGYAGWEDFDLVYYCDIPRHDLDTSRRNNRMRKNILEKRHCCTGNIILGLLFMLVMIRFKDYSGLMINLRLP